MWPVWPERWDDSHKPSPHYKGLLIIEESLGGVDDDQHVLMFISVPAGKS